LHWKLKAIVKQRRARHSLRGASLTALCGLLLWATPIGQPWVNASYDYSFRFGARAVTNKVALILMDNEAYDHFHQTRGQPWDRALHARMLNKLADDGCALVVMDSFFRGPGDSEKDEALANAMRRVGHIALMAEQSRITRPGLAGMHPILPAEPFLSAAATNWGVAWLDPAPDLIVRQLWPFPFPGPYPSLPETAARMAGARLSASPQKRWLRYYGPDGAWTKLSYGFALTEPKDFFRDQIVFIGIQPKSSALDGEVDQFRTPYTRWSGETSGGVEIILTSFLNLVNNDWLRRPGEWMELVVLTMTGLLLGGGFGGMRPLTASVCAMAAALAVTLGAVLYSYFSNYWFPWLAISGAQVPCALAWALLGNAWRRRDEYFARAGGAPARHDNQWGAPKVPGFKLINPPFGQGAYGRVWLARNSAGQWRAVKAIYLASFNDDTVPYEREFNGVSRYKPISDKHPGLLRVEFVSEKLARHFYYVMELGDSLEPGWQRQPSTYRPHDLASERARAQDRRLPVKNCVLIGLRLSEALDFLHRQGLTHRDIKPQNIIFVNGEPKLADLGLIAEIRPPEQQRTAVGTPGYMPPPPEMPGTPQADVYALGIMLYVLSTGREAAFFPNIATTLLENQESAEFFDLNAIIRTACQPDPALRYASALEMHQALKDALQSLDGGMSDKTG
jgi:CHASE2 domain-containing sensor protein